MSSGRWRCPICKVEILIEGRKITIFMVGRQFPKHGGCELGKDIDHIDFSKLEKIG